MSIIREIYTLIRGKVVIRCRNDDELSGGDVECAICSRQMVLSPGALCMVINDEGPLCTICGKKYAPEMVALLGNENEITDENKKSYPYKTKSSDLLVTTADIEGVKEDVAQLVEVTEKLSRGVARGIVEAPAGHIGLMHYAKDIRRPLRRENESQKDFDLRIRTFRIGRLYEKIREDTTERVERIKDFLQKCGISL